jgi:hypothetical protein
VLSALVAGWAALAYACGSSDENPAVTRGPGTGDGGGDGTVNPQNQDGATGPALCGTYGGYDNVKTMAASIVQKAEADCRLSAGFANVAGDPQAQAHMLDCFTLQLGTAFKCTAPGIPYTAGTSADQKGQKCRDMTSAHQQLPGDKKLYLADYNAYMEAIAAVFNAQSGANPDDLKTIASYFNGYQANIVTAGLNNQPKANAYCPGPACVDPYDGKTTCSAPEAGILDAGKDVTEGGPPPSDGGDGG